MKGPVSREVDGWNSATAATQSTSRIIGQALAMSGGVRLAIGTGGGRKVQGVENKESAEARPDCPSQKQSRLVHDWAER